MLNEVEHTRILSVRALLNLLRITGEIAVTKKAGLGVLPTIL